MGHDNQMEKKTIIKIAVAAVVIIIAIFAANSAGFFKPQPEVTPEMGKITLFYGHDCPHCKDLELWMTNNGINDKFSIDKLEVQYNKDNQNLLRGAAKFCNIAETSIGVPLLWTGQGDCLLGLEPIQEFFNQETEKQNDLQNQEVDTDKANEIPE
jgi:glutaredoxin